MGAIAGAIEQYKAELYRIISIRTTANAVISRHKFPLAGEPLIATWVLLLVCYYRHCIIDLSNSIGFLNESQ